MLIFKKFLLISATILIIDMLISVHVLAHEIFKIAFISTERIFREAIPARTAQIKLKKEFLKREKDIQNIAYKLKLKSERLDRDTAILSDENRVKLQHDIVELDKELQRKQREFREDINQRRNEELSIVLERTNKVIRQLAEHEKYDIVFQDAVYASKRIDITDIVLKELSK